MAKFKKSHILMITLLTALLIVTPLISSSSRPKYLYFVINFLIIALGAEAGLLSAFSKPLEADQKKHASSVNTATTKQVIQVQPEANNSSPDQVKAVSAPEKKVKFMKKCVSEKTGVGNSVNNDKKVEKVKKCPSMPSLFFIGGGDNEAAEEDDHESGDDDVLEMEAEVGDISGQELFTKAETFIGNFYKQLKMQREDSLKRIHGFYQKAF